MVSILEKKMNNYKVVKRSGETVPFQIDKIRTMIEWALKGTDLASLKLESNMEMVFKSKMTSKEIHQSLINAALRLTSLEEPEWSNIAAKLKVVSLYKDASQARDYNKFGYDNYPRFLKQAWKLNVYDNLLKEKYNEEELKIAGKFIKPEYDYLFDFAGINALDHKYLMKHDGKVFELPQEAFLTISLYIEQNQPKEVRLEKVLDTYTKIATRKISLATPILLNLRKPNGNLSSCFITAMDDDLLSIYYVLEQCARISQNGGGVGINISRVRSLGGFIQGHKNASGGVIPWTRLINNTAVAVNQLGKRPGAMTVSLDIWHRDIENFLETQTENGDLEMKAMAINPQIVIVDEFMKRVEDNDVWYMFDPNEIKTKFGQDMVLLWGDNFSKFYNKLVKAIEDEAEKAEVSIKKSYGREFVERWNTVVNDKNKSKLPELVNKVKAKDLIKHIMKVWVETGRPYISFKDTINRYNPNKDSGIILGGNLCMESFSNTSPSTVVKDYFDPKSGKVVREISPGDLHTCNLCSVNMAFTEDHELESVCSTSVRILDNLIDFTTAPVQEGMLHNNKYRTIGVGFMGYADYTVKKGIPYSKSAELADEVFENIAYYCTMASVELAKERGSFDSYEQSEYKKGILLGKDKAWFKKNTKDSARWVKLLDLIKEHGIRNSQITAIAPNSSTSLLQGCTASILPIYGKFYMDNGKTTVPITPPFIKEGFWLYQENKNIDQRIVIEVTSKIQKWIDTGISMELLVNPNLDYVDAKYIYQLFIDSWKKECKTIYYVRCIQTSSESKPEEDCASCAG
jgi:ribonucleoside-diphosphate reductase alpha chain